MRIIKEFQAAKKAISKCGGDCKNCKHCIIDIRDISPRSACYFFRCDHLHGDGGSDTIKGVYKDAIEFLDFEIDMYNKGGALW